MSLAYLKSDVLKDEHFSVEDFTVSDRVKFPHQPLLLFELFTALVDDTVEGYYDIPDPSISLRLFSQVIQPISDVFFTYLTEHFSSCESLDYTWHETFDWQTMALHYAHGLVSLDYLVEIIREWACDPYFVELSAYADVASEATIRSPGSEQEIIPLFRPILDQANELRALLLRQVTTFIQNSLSYHFDTYRMLNWNQNELLHPLQPTLIPATDAMVDLLKLLDRLVWPLYKSPLRTCSSKESSLHAPMRLVLDFIQIELLLKDIILQRPFNGFGVIQWQKDWSYLTLTLTEHPLLGAFFQPAPRLTEAMVLLQLPSPSEKGPMPSPTKEKDELTLKKLFDLIEDALPFKAISTLKSLGITHLTLPECRRILLARSSSF